MFARPIAGKLGSVKHDDDHRPAIQPVALKRKLLERSVSETQWKGTAVRERFLLPRLLGDQLRLLRSVVR